MYRSVYEIGGAAAVVALVAGSASGAANVNATVPMAVSVVTSVAADGCTNNPGPFITLSGELTLGGISARLIFQNNVKGTHTHTEDVTADVVIIPAGEKITFAKQPPEGGVGGDPFIYVQFTDGAGNPMSDETFLGRCVQGLDTGSAAFSLPADASVDVSTSSCDNSPGPFITLSGEIALSGINARLIFRNNVRGTHTRTEDVVVDVVILPAGETIRFAKQPPQGGVGGNPRISIQFLDGSANPLGDPIFLGKCVQLN